MVDLTSFQTLCERKVSELLRSYGRRLENRRVGQVRGFVEPFISVCGRISGTDVTIYIYEDGAEFTNHGFDVRFERPDYDTGEALIDAFIEHLSKYLDRKAAEEAGELQEPENPLWLGKVARMLRALLTLRR